MRICLKIVNLTNKNIFYRIQRKIIQILVIYKQLKKNGYFKNRKLHKQKVELVE